MRNVPAEAGDAAKMARNEDNAKSVDTPEGPESEIWVRAPKNGERLESLTRASIYGIISNPETQVTTVSLKSAPGAARGCRLIGLKSLRAYIARLAGEQNAHRQRREAAK
jgi:hypothetical protein